MIDDPVLKIVKIRCPKCGNIFEVYEDCEWAGCECGYFGHIKQKVPSEKSAAWIYLVDVAERNKDISLGEAFDIMLKEYPSAEAHRKEFILGIARRALRRNNIIQ